MYVSAATPPQTVRVMQSNTEALNFMNDSSSNVAKQNETSKEESQSLSKLCPHSPQQSNYCSLNLDSEHRYLLCWDN